MVMLGLTGDEKLWIPLEGQRTFVLVGDDVLKIWFLKIPLILLFADTIEKDLHGERLPVWVEILLHRVHPSPTLPPGVELRGHQLPRVLAVLGSGEGRSGSGSTGSSALVLGLDALVNIDQSL